MGKNAKATIGFREYMGVHMGFCRGPVDAVLEVRGDDKTAWTGSLTASGSIWIDAPDLYGGEKKEGGLQGALTVMMGEASQMPNTYLALQQGGLQPAYRGLCTAVFRGLVGAISPYIKPISVRVMRAVKGWENDDCWEPTLAVVGRGMNPIHIIMQCLTDSEIGAGYARADIDLDNFRAAAVTCKDEDLGLCLGWRASTPVTEFIDTVCSHIGAMRTEDPETLLQQIVLVRGGYDVNTLVQLDESNVIAVTRFQQTALADTVNEVLVRYHDVDTNKDVATAPAHNLANIQAQGRIVSQSVDYPGFYKDSQAARAALRDCHAKSSLPVSVELTVMSKLWRIKRGDVVAFSWGRKGVVQMPLRVLETNRGERPNSPIKLICVEDQYGLPLTAYTAPQTSGWVPPDTTPHPLTAQQVVEAPYRDLAHRLRQADLNALAADAGYYIALGARPAGVAYNFEMQERTGTAAFADAGAGDFSPGGLLDAAMIAEAGPTIVTLTSPVDLDIVAVGTAALIDDEIVRVDAIDPIANTLTLARGCADTVPAAHALGARVWCYEDLAGYSTTEYIAGETVDVKLLTRTSRGRLDPAAATAVSATFADRQIRPYPPGNFMIQGVHYPAAVEGALTLTWSHRDRLLQADQIIDTTQGDIGPEAGVSYAITYYGEVGTVLRTQTAITGTSDTWLLADEIAASALTSPAPARSLVSPGVPDYSATVLADSPVAYWGLNETTGTTAADNSGNALSGTYTGGYTLGAASPSNAPGAVLLDGSSGYIDCGAPAALDLTAAWTLEIWCYQLATPNGSCLMAEQWPGAGNVLYALGFSTLSGLGGSNLLAGFYTGSAWRAVTGPALANNAWHHVVSTWDGTTLNLYVDGALVASGAPGAAPVAGIDRIYLGKRWDAGFSPFFNGRLAAAAIYGTALSAARVLAHYDAGIATAFAGNNPKPRANGTLRVLLKAQRAGFDSMQQHDVTVARAGYGYQFGNYYGGV